MNGTGWSGSCTDRSGGWSPSGTLADSRRCRAGRWPNRRWTGRDPLGQLRRRPGRSSRYSPVLITKIGTGAAACSGSIPFTRSSNNAMTAASRSMSVFGRSPPRRARGRIHRAPPDPSAAAAGRGWPRRSRRSWPGADLLVVVPAGDVQHRHVDVAIRRWSDRLRRSVQVRWASSRASSATRTGRLIHGHQRPVPVHLGPVDVVRVPRHPGVHHPEPVDVHRRGDARRRPTNGSLGRRDHRAQRRRMLQRGEPLASGWRSRPVGGHVPVDQSCAATQPMTSKPSGPSWR